MSASSAPPAPPAPALKRLHSKILKALTRSSATNVDMTLFRWLNVELDEVSASKPPPPFTARAVLRVLAPARYATVAFGWQKRLARRVIEHPKVGAPGVVNFVCARTAWFDTEARRALAASSSAAGVRQVVCLAAGYEMRAWRLAATASGGALPPGTTFYEVDLPHASEQKQKLVSKLGLGGGGATVRFVEADLSDPPGTLRAKLVAAGFDPSKPALFTFEGLLYYLEPAAAAALLKEVAGLMKEGDDGQGAGGGGSGKSRLALDYLHSDALAAGQARGIGVVSKSTKKSKKSKADDPFAPPPPRLPRAYEVTARSVAAKGEPFRSAAGSSALEAAAWLSEATGGVLALREHVPTRAALEALLPPSPRGNKDSREILSFYSFLTAEVAEAVPPTFNGGGVVGAA